MMTEKEIQMAKDEMFPYQENVGRSYEQAWAASGFELGAHWVLNKLKSNGYSDEIYKQGELIGNPTNRDYFSTDIKLK